MKLAVTIDTEEDNWNHYSRTENPCKNLEKLPVLQELFAKYNIVPTYLINYPVATNDRGLAILEQVQKISPCEIGMHCHPWNTPPFTEEISTLATFTENLPYEAIISKFTTLRDAIHKNTGIMPTSFRGGRFSFGPKTAKALVALGFTVDTSVTSFFDWGECCEGNDYSAMSPDPYLLNPESPLVKTKDGKLLEIPATNGYLQPWFGVANSVQRLFAIKPLQKLHVLGILDKLGIINRRGFGPETWPAHELIKLLKAMQKRNAPIINFYFHSTSLMSGFGEFVKTESDEKEIMERIRSVVQYTSGNNIESVSLKDFAKARLV